MVRGLLHPGCGPLVRVRLHGRAGVALLDTGASASVVDRELARALELPSPGAAAWCGVSAEGGRSVAALRTVDLQIVGDARIFRLDMIEVAGIRGSVPGVDVLCLLGWDFLGSCTLFCDGPAGMFQLVLPALPRRRR